MTLDTFADNVRDMNAILNGLKKYANAVGDLMGRGCASRQNKF